MNRELTLDRVGLAAAESREAVVDSPEFDRVRAECEIARALQVSAAVRWAPFERFVFDNLAPTPARV
jgi:hypothetical protein